ncbi:MAG: DUF1080 domain-containing protein [Candidatus Omnitrophica bacterium]|nr:DUF1080 domain-containing protein [Candidatus Omnitrophota bacterium]
MSNNARAFKRWKPLVIVSVFLLVLLFLNVCSTGTRRSREFEETIRSFAERREPDSEIALFNGQDLSGWVVHGWGKWTVEDGVMTVRRGIGYLATCYEAWEDFILTLDIRVSEKGNSGVFFRARHPGFGFRPWPQGYEAQVDNHDPRNYTGSLYGRVRVTTPPVADEEWFTMRIAALGPRIQIQVNGETVVNATDPVFAIGFIALQAHDPFSRVDFRDIRLRIPAEEE